jgi:LysM repeat protein
MRFYLRKLAILTLLSILFFVLAACAAPTLPILPTATATPVAYLMPYLSPTPSRTALPATPLTTLPVTPPPSPTPFLYILAKNDTLLGLAFRFGVSLEQILAANPGINPHYLTVGKAIVIPIKEDEPTVVPSPTVVPLQLGNPHCYPAGDGGTWCVLALTNDQDQAVENVSVWLGLFSLKGDNLASQVVIPPLNLLDVGQALPLMAYFNQPFDPGNTVHAELLSALSVEKKTKRYLTTSVQINKVQISPSGKQAEVTGQVVLSDSIKASALWVVAVAYNDLGQIVGMRKWEAETDPGCLAPSAGKKPLPAGTPAPSATPVPPQPLPRKCQTFDVTVFSLGPLIKNVEILVEARP